MSQKDIRASEGGSTDNQTCDDVTLCACPGCVIPADYTEQMGGKPVPVCYKHVDRKAGEVADFNGGA